MNISKNILPSLKQLVEKREQNIASLIAYTFEELEQIKSDLYCRIEEIKQAGSKDSIVFIDEKLSQVSEAIVVKRGNDEQAWDYLS
jgi:hypothetical protein